MGRCVLRRRGISLRRRRSWCVSTDPEFSRKAADVVGLYLDPHENAVVLAVDEKPHTQAPERAQGWLRLPDDKALTGFSHGYKRHGTTTLFAALEVATASINACRTERPFPQIVGAEPNIVRVVRRVFLDRDIAVLNDRFPPAALG